MITLLLFLGLIIGLYYIPLSKRIFPTEKNIIAQVFTVSTFFFLAFVIFTWYGYKLKGQYTFTVLTTVFLVSAIVYLVVLENSKTKVIIAFLTTPLIALGIIALTFNNHIYDNQLDKTYKIIVTTGGLLACGEHIQITQTRFGIFDKDIKSIDNLCLKGIHKIETYTIDDQRVVLLIHHNGKLDSENPYRYGWEK
jgi:hypothetical protein